MIASVPGDEKRDDSQAPVRRVLTRRWLFGDRRALFAVSYVVLLVLVAVLAPVLEPADPNIQNLAGILQGPSAHHLLGTDQLGRDVLSRLLYGTRSSLIAVAVSTGIATVIGVPVGVISGYFGGKLDSALMRITDALLAFPALVLAMAVAASLGPGLVSVMTAVGIVFSPLVARLARGQALEVRERAFVHIAHTYGASTRRIIRRHVLPNLVQPLIVQIAFIMGLALLAESGLSFLGLGVQPPTASWGSMLADAFQYLPQAPDGIYAPGIAIALTVLAFNTLADSLRDAFDPSPAMRRQRRAAGQIRLLVLGKRIGSPRNASVGDAGGTRV
jgi:peptide/nickel transport system permease protein